MDEIILTDRDRAKRTGRGYTTMGSRRAPLEFERWCDLMWAGYDNYRQTRWGSNWNRPKTKPVPNTIHGSGSHLPAGDRDRDQDQDWWQKYGQGQDWDSWRADGLFDFFFSVRGCFIIFLAIWLMLVLLSYLTCRAF